jgi:hypothetical protein
VFWTRIELRSLLNDAGDINDDELIELPVLGPANLLKLTFDEIYLGLLHTNVKYSAILPQPQFKALPRDHPIRPFTLCLPEGFRALPLAFFKLFFLK